MRSVSGWLCLAVLVTSPPLTIAQVTSAEGQSLDSLLAAARRYLGSDAPDSARALYNVVLSRNWKPRMAQLGLVQTAIATQSWSEGASVCGDILKKSKDDLQAHYYSGICRREAGFLVSAVSHFQAVLDLDSLFRDVLYQYALVREYEDDFAQAIDLGLRQVRLHPESAAGQIGLLRIFRHYIAATDFNEALQWLRSRSDQYSEFALGELLRRHKRFQEARQILEGLNKARVVPFQACSLSLARLFAQLGEDSSAEALYWEGVDNVAGPIGPAILFDDLKHIMSDRELVQYRALTSDRDRITLFHEFWEIRNPIVGSRTNARMIEHFRRYSVAEQKYEYFGNRSKQMNPDQLIRAMLPKVFFLNREFNDKGAIYMRRGPPDEIVMSSAREHVERATPADPVFKFEESWLYLGSGGERQQIFEFICENRGENYWTLTVLPQNPEMVTLLTMWDNRYADINNPHVQAQIESRAQSDVAAGLSTDRNTWKPETKALAIPHAIDAFRSEKNKTLVDIGYAIPVDQLVGEMRDPQDIIAVEVGLSIMIFAGERTDIRVDTLRIPLENQSKGSYISSFREQLSPDSVRIAMHVRAFGDRLIGTWVEFLRIPRFSSTEFSLSDLEFLLPSGLPASIEIEGAKVIQSPFSIYRKSARLYAYVQIYNLVKDIYGKARYSASYSLIPRDPLRPEEAVNLGEVSRDVAEENHADFHALDLSGVHPGKYVVTVMITDRKRVASIARSKEIEIIP